MSTADLLTQGIAAARAGRKDEAQATLLKVLEADDRSEMAWLWLSGIFETPAERRVCLENVLTINPGNAHARRGLELLDRTHPAPTPVAPPAPEEAAAPPAPEEAEAPTPQAALLPRPADGGAPSQATLALVAAPATSDTIELPRAPAETAAPARQPWWRPRKAAPAVAAALVATPAAPPPPAIVAPPPPPEATLTLPAEAVVADDAEEPCPYCGATTMLAHRSCPTCRKSLMVRGARREKRSVALYILVALYALSSLGALAGGVMTIISLVGLASAASALGMELPVASLAGAIGGIVLGVVLCFALTLGLYRRRPWAYAMHWLSLGLGVLSTLALLVISAVAGASLAAALGPLQAGASGDAAGSLAAAAGSVGLVLACNVLSLVGMIALTVLSHRDFYGPMVRMSNAGLTTEGDPYNLGIAYRNQGMWYMAAHNWELAARANPRDLTVRRVLGLAYAQLGRFEQARDELAVALAMKPGDPQLSQDLALVERLAAKRALG